MKPIPGRSMLSVLLSTGVCTALVAAALAQLPVPGGGAGPKKGGPAPAPGPGPAPGGGPGAGPGPGGPGGAPGAPSPTFELRICNKSNDIPVIFVAAAGAVGQQFRAQGWTQVQRGQCAPVGTFMRPSAWFHARDPKGITWNQNPDANLCVNLNAGFEYTWDGSGRSCTQAETAVPFAKIDIKPEFNAFTMTLN